MPRYRSFPLVGLILLIATISGCGANQAKPGPATPDPALSTAPAKPGSPATSDAAGKSTRPAELTLVEWCVVTISRKSCEPS